MMEIPNFCIDCGKKIGKVNIRCWDCHVIYRKTPEYRQMMCDAKAGGLSEQALLVMSKKQSEKMQDPDRRANLSLKAKQQWEDPDFRAKRQKAVKQTWADKNRRMKQSELSKNAWARGDFDHLSEAMKAAWARGCFDNIHSEESKQKQSESQKRNWQEGKYDDRKIGIISPTEPEQNIMNVLDELDVEYEFNDFKLGRYCYDFYLSDYKLIIEYDGWFWHSSGWAIEKGIPERDKVKDEMAEKAGLRLLRLQPAGNYDLTYDEIYALLKEELDVAVYPKTN